LGGPNWIKAERYDIRAEAGAEAEGSASEAQVKLMAQTMLADRFHLKLRRETRETSVYALIAARNGIRLQTAKDKTAYGGQKCINIGAGYLDARGATMAAFVDVLNHLVDRPVLDKTGLDGNYDFTLRYDQSSVQDTIPVNGAPPTDGPSIFAVIQDLGIKLNPEKDPIGVLVIDSVDHPSGN
jgi:uncharacterized protein (TIGR03435 family)